MMDLLKSVFLKGGMMIITSLFIISFAFDCQRCGFRLSSFSPWIHDDISIDINNNTKYESFYLTRAILLRGICFCYMIALKSVSVQAEGLFDFQYGLLPLETTLNNIDRIIKRSLSISPSLKSALPVADTEAMKSNPINIFVLRLTVWIMSPAAYISRYTCILSLLSSNIAMLGIFYPHPIILVTCYVMYMSFKKIGGIFLNFAWDALLLEAGFYAIFSSLATSTASITATNWLYRILLFRLMFGSGMVKLFSRDHAWNESFTAMNYHFLTQPLPRAISAFFFELPAAMLRLATVSVIVIESAGPILSLIPFFEVTIFVLFITLQASIQLTGNYGFFNILTMVLSICLLPDSKLRMFYPHHSVDISMLVLPHVPASINIKLHEFLFSWDSLYHITNQPWRHHLYHHLPDMVPHMDCWMSHYDVIISSCYQYYRPAINSIIVFAAVLIVATDFQAIDLLIARLAPRLTSDANYSHPQPRPILRLIHAYLSPLYLGGHYGLFGTMTKVREEIVIFVSKDGESSWQPIEFSYKPGIPSQLPRQVVPWFHMPRVDWMMWFAAIRPHAEDWPDWFWRLLIAILENRPEIRDLLHPTLNHKIFIDGHQEDKDDDGSKPSYPYRYLRVQLFEYRFGVTIARQRAQLLNKAMKDGSTRATTDAIQSHPATANTSLSLPSTSSLSSASDSTMGGLISPRDVHIHVPAPTSSNRAANVPTLSTSTISDASKDGAGDRPSLLSAAASDLYDNSPNPSPRIPSISPTSSTSSSQSSINTTPTSSSAPAIPRSNSNPTPTPTPRPCKRRFWSIRFVEDILPPMPLTHIILYREKIRNKRRYLQRSNSIGSDEKDKDMDKLEISAAKAADIIQRYTSYSNTPSNTTAQEGRRTSAMHQNKAIRAPIQRSPGSSPRVSTPSSHDHDQSSSPLIKSQRKSIRKERLPTSPIQPTTTSLNATSILHCDIHGDTVSATSTTSSGSGSPIVYSSDASAGSLEGYTMLRVAERQLKSSTHINHDEDSKDAAT